MIITTNKRREIFMDVMALIVAGVLVVTKEETSCVGVVEDRVVVL
jgi:hypothetical protein